MPDVKIVCKECVYIYCISYPYILATGMDMNLDMLGGRDGQLPAAYLYLR